MGCGASGAAYRLGPLDGESTVDTPESVQLAKLLADIAMLEMRCGALNGSDADAGLVSDLKSKRQQVVSLRRRGVVPSPGGEVVFRQLDIDNTGFIDAHGLRRLLNFCVPQKKNSEMGLGTAEEILLRLDTDGDGLVNKEEWLRNLHRLPGLRKILSELMDPETGRLRRYRSCSEQLAALMCQVLTLERRCWAGENKFAQLKAKRQTVEALRKKGIRPCAAVFVFQQLDTDCTGHVNRVEMAQMIRALWKTNPHALAQGLDTALDTEQMENIETVDDESMSLHIPRPPVQQDVWSKTGAAGQLDGASDLPRRRQSWHLLFQDDTEMGRGGTKAFGKTTDIRDDTTANNVVTEEEWLEELHRLPGLRFAIEAAVDPDHHRLLAYRTPGERLARLLVDIRRMELEGTKPQQLAEKHHALRRLRDRYAGVKPSVGALFFNALDREGAGSIRRSDLSVRLLALEAPKPPNGLQDWRNGEFCATKSFDEILERLDKNEDMLIDESEWLMGLYTEPWLQKALELDLEKSGGIDEWAAWSSSSPAPSTTACSQSARENSAANSA
jgi:Ca2+-binding EF-hand superfamily protein